MRLRWKQPCAADYQQWIDRSLRQAASDAVEHAVWLLNEGDAWHCWAEWGAPYYPPHLILNVRREHVHLHRSWQLEGCSIDAALLERLHDEAFTWFSEQVALARSLGGLC